MSGLDAVVGKELITSGSHGLKLGALLGGVLNGLFDSLLDGLLSGLLGYLLGHLLDGLLAYLLIAPSGRLFRRTHVSLIVKDA